MSVALLLGGGAPTVTLQSGALAALDEMGANFSAISTAGAGVVVGLLYAAPKGMSRQEALRNTIHFGVADEIYNQFPVNYKVFHKPGPTADFFRKFLQMLPRMNFSNTSTTRLFNDWMTLMFSCGLPSDLNHNSKGLCEHAPWIDEVVDFDALQSFQSEFYMNAYNITDQKMEIFNKEEITPGHFHAALAFPFIYPPYKLNGKTYIEGSAIDTLCFEGLLNYREEAALRLQNTDPDDDLEPLKTIVVFDVLSSKNLIREPRDLYDAWIQSIMVPLVEIAKDDIELFEYRYNRDWKLDLLKINFDIPDDHWPNVLDWSYSNLKTLYELGYQAGLNFYKEHKEIFKPETA